MKKIIALDLDGTLLNSKKELTERTYETLSKAAEMGAEIVPATGRFYKGMPEVIRALPFVHYAITINGAQVTDVRTGEALYDSSIPVEEALNVLEYLDTLPVLYDCYVDGWGYMTDSMQQRAGDYITSAHMLKMVLELRDPVPELKAWIREGRHCPQKLQAFPGGDIVYRDEVIRMLKEKYPDLAISTADPNNIEINTADANKGRALLGLAEVLGIDRADTIAFGDGLNDLSMIQAAGTGIAMANGSAEVREAADMITGDCDSDGVAAAIEKLLLCSKCYKLEIFIPESHFARLREALQAVDAGHIGNYDCCLSYSRVTGMWRPLAGTDPFIGRENEISEEEELKVEVTVKAGSLDDTIRAVKAIHPYEEPVINVIELYRTGI